MSLTTVPEFILLDTLNKGIAYVRDNYDSATDKTKTWLYLTFGQNSFDGYDLYDNAVAMICTEEDNPRHFHGDLMFNSERDGFPSFHITLPSESPADGNSLGIGLGVEDNYEDDTSYTEVYTRRVQTNYNIVIMSDNSNEVVVLYHFLRALIIACSFHLHQNKIQNIIYSGQDVQPYQQLQSQAYIRAISIGFQYETSVPSINPINFITDVDTSGKPVLEIVD